MNVVLKKHGLPGRLIAFCGADGVGKSTVMELLIGALVEQGNDRSNVLRLRQPSEWWRSDPRVKSTLMYEGDGEKADEYALGIFGAADRFNQQAQFIEPALAAGRTVVMDRYVYCLLAYYMARDEPRIGGLATICEPLFQPDITFVLDCPPLIAIGRVAKRDGLRSERTDQQIGPTTRYIEAYRVLADANNLSLLSAVESPEAILAKIRTIISSPGAVMEKRSPRG